MNLSCLIPRFLNKEFHNIKDTNKEKLYAYTAYWLLRRKPIQVKNHFTGCEFINEWFVTVYTMSQVPAARRIDSGKNSENPTYNDFYKLLFYNMKYRPISQQSLELMIEAFFCGYDFPG